jgi:RNA-directed DNA polymerase
MLIDRLVQTSKIERSKLLSLANSASERYKVYFIPKRSGGVRMIEHPSRELKALQRWIVRAIIARLPTHEAATAYRKGSGIRDNAERHKSTRFTNRYDFKDFFPSFKQDQIESFLRTETFKLGMYLTDEDLHFIGNIVCRNGRLTIGAPSSPAITNAMMFEFDQTLAKQCEENDLIFTRYADDIFVSSSKPNRLDGMERIILLAKRNIVHLKLKLNRQKTTILSKKYSRRIAGVVITSENRLSIGRERKRHIKSLIHKWINKKLVESEYEVLRGYLAFARDIEPDFEVRLRKKYGEYTINRLLSNSPTPI